jgi:hypothetical protein
MATVRLRLNIARLRLNLVFIAWQRRAALIDLAKANDLLYKASPHLSTIPQNKRIKNPRLAFDI